LKWSIDHQTISPGHSQSNGAAEAALKIAKRLMKRRVISQEDPYLALLNIRNTPTENMSASPAQRSLGRQTRTLVPVALSKLASDSKLVNESKVVKERLKQDLSKKFSSRRTLSPLTPGQTVSIQPVSGRNEA